MKRKTTLVLLAGIPLAALCFAAPAFAQGTPGTCTTAAPVPTSGTAPNSGSGTSNGGACSVEGSVTVSTVEAFEVGVSSFGPFTTTGSTLSPSGGFNMYAYANSPSGYYVSEAVTTPFAGGTITSDLLAPADFSAGTDGSLTCDTAGPTLADTAFTADAANDGDSTALNVVTVPCPSSGYNYNNGSTVSGDAGMPAGTDQIPVNGWEYTASVLTTGTVAPAQSYSGDVTLALWS